MSSSIKDSCSGLPICLLSATTAGVGLELDPVSVVLAPCFVLYILTIYQSQLTGQYLKISSRVKTHEYFRIFLLCSRTCSPRLSIGGCHTYLLISHCSVLCDSWFICLANVSTIQFTLSVEVFQRRMLSIFSTHSMPISLFEAHNHSLLH